MLVKIVCCLNKKAQLSALSGSLIRLGSLFTFLFFLGFLAVAQKNTTHTKAGMAPDFTGTDTDGNLLNLYGRLAEGKIVVLDFFYVDCSYCQQYAPVLDQAYSNYGSNNENVLFWAIDNTDNTADVLAFKDSFNVSMPCISGEDGGGDSITVKFAQNFNLQGYPTYCVICQNKVTYWNINYPPTDAGFDSYITTCLSQTKVDNLEETSNAVFPIPARDKVFINVSERLSFPVDVKILDLSGRIVSYKNVESKTRLITIALDDIPDGAYLLQLNTADRKEIIQKLLIAK